VPDFRLIENGDELAETLDRHADEPRYALDTEFHRERTYYPHLALVQIAWPGDVIVVDPLAVDPKALVPLIEGPALAVLHAADQDLEVLSGSCGAVPDRLWDTQLAAGFLGLASPSLSALHERFLGHPVPKGDRLTDWLKRPLDESQLAYAASDVAELLEIQAIEEAQLVERGRLVWTTDECGLLLASAVTERDPDAAWLRIKHARQLRGNAAAAAQDLAAWRERRAATIDQPTRFVLSDLGVMGIAQSRPKSIEDLRRVRGVEGRHLRDGVADELLGIVASAGSKPRSTGEVRTTAELQRDLRPLSTLISAWVSQRAREHEIDTTLLATRADIEALLQGDPDARLAQGWRKQIVGEPLERLMQGEAALAFDGQGGLLLEERSHKLLE
jgi:ribonuclease D